MSDPPAFFTPTSKPRKTLWYHAHRLWLFIFSDLKTIVILKTAFGSNTLLSGPKLTRCARPMLAVLDCLPLIVIWTSLNLPPLTMDNQHGVDDLREDKKNKPWRPIPAGRLTFDETRIFLPASYVAAVLASACFGGRPECLAFIIQGWIYNELGAANNSCGIYLWFLRLRAVIATNI